MQELIAREITMAKVRVNPLTRELLATYLGKCLQEEVIDYMVIEDRTISRQLLY